MVVLPKRGSFRFTAASHHSMRGMGGKPDDLVIIWLGGIVLKSVGGGSCTVRKLCRSNYPLTRHIVSTFHFFLMTLRYFKETVLRDGATCSLTSSWMIFTMNSV